MLPPVPLPPLSVRRPPWRRRLRILLWRTRLPVAATFLGLAAGLVVGELRPPPPVTVDVVVAARDLAAGTTLTSSDVRTEAVAPAVAVPAARLQGGSPVVGRRTAVPVPAGLPLVPGVLTGGHLTGPPGTVVTAVRLADQSVVRLLSPGDRVDVLATTPEGGPAVAVARAALVLPAPDDPSTGGLLSGSAAAPDPLPLVLAVRPEEAAAVSATTGDARLSVVVVP